MANSKEVQITIEFTVWASLKVPVEELNSTDYNLEDPQELQEAIEEWVGSNAMPNTYYQSYSSDSGMVKIREQKATYAVSSDIKVSLDDEEDNQCRADRSDSSPYSWAC